MDSTVKFVSAWPELVARAFTDHTLAFAIVTIGAIGIFVVLQRELRPYRLATNLAYVATGWLVLVSVLVFIMQGLRAGWAFVETATPFIARFSAYLYGIYERHPIMVLVIVGLAATSYFLEQSWPTPVSWGPVRALCAILGAGFLVHVSAPIADLIEGDPSALPAPKFVLPKTPVKEAVAAAIKSGDRRYLSVPQCVEELSGYPAPEAGKVALPAQGSVKKLGPTCVDTFGKEGVARVRSYRDYAAEYNKLMFEHNKSLEAKPAEDKLPEDKVTQNKPG